MNESKLVVIREYDSINDAEWDKSILEGEGVYSMIRNEIMSAIYPTGVMPAQLVVRSKDRAKAAKGPRSGESPRKTPLPRGHSTSTDKGSADSRRV